MVSIFLLDFTDFRKNIERKFSELETAFLLLTYDSDKGLDKHWYFSSELVEFADGKKGLHDGEATRFVVVGH